MKAICVKNTLEKTAHSRFPYLNTTDFTKYDLTIGKVYEVYELHEFAPRILSKKVKLIDDSRKIIHVPFDFFKSIEDDRDDKIEEFLKN